VICAVLWCIPLSQADAQIIAGRLLGRVTDSSGAVIPGASVVATENATGFTYKTKATSAGDFVFEAVDPGTYTLTVQAPGFSQAVVTHLVVHAQAALNQEVNLKPGATSETVTVTGASPLLQTQDASIGNNLTAQQVNDMPLAGRDFTQLVQLAAGVTTGPSSFSSGGTSTSFVSSLGNIPEQNDFRLNGIDDNEEMFGGGQVQGASGNAQTAVVPPPDAIQEFNLQTGDYSAEFGHSTGAIFNAQIKSGTNSLHGSVWEYNRNTIFNANTYANKLSGTPRTAYHENQYGFTVGGPVLLPKIYNGKNKSFFFVSWQNSVIRTPESQSSFVPTDAMIKSGFTDYRELLNPDYVSGTKTDSLGRTFPNATIFDPATTRYVAVGAVDPVTGLTNTGALGTPYVSDPFYTNGSLGGITNFTTATQVQYLNQLPSSRLDPNAVKLMGRYPAPNTTYNPNIGINYYQAASESNTLNQLDLRFDQHFGDKDMVFATYDESVNNRFVPPPLPSGDGGGYGTGNLHGPRYGISLGYTHVFSPTLTNEAHAGWMHSIEELTSVDGTQMGIPEQYGIQGIPQVNGNGGLPEIDTALFTTLGGTVGGYMPTLQTVRSLELMDNVTKVFSTQTLKVGYQLNLINAPIIQPPYGAGDIWYNGNYTDIPSYDTYTTNYAEMLLTPTAAQYPQYGGIDNFGGLSGSYINNYTESYFRHVYMGAFVQDDWRVTPKLTLNLGLRWDLVTPYYDKNGHAANFVQNGGGSGTSGTYYIAKDGCNTPMSAAFKQILAESNVAIQCASSNVMGTYQHLNFAPRLGFAYSIAPKMVIRGGFGIAYGGLQNLGYGQLGQAYPFLTTSERIQNYYDTPTMGPPLQQPDGSTTVMEDAFDIPGLLDPVNTTADVLGRPSLAGRDYHVDTPYQETMNLTFQHQLTANDAFSVGYVGSFGRHVLTVGSNNAKSSIMPTGTNSLSPTVVGHIPMPALSTGSTLEYGATSSYTSMQAIYQHQFSYGIDVSANFTWSKCMSDQLNPQGSNSVAGGSYRAEWIPGLGKRFDWALCSFDAANATHVSGTWHLPVGRGKAFAGNVNRLTDALIGGWVTNLIYIQQSGQPLTIGCDPATSLQGCHANKVPGVGQYANAHNRVHWLNINAFAEPPRATAVTQTNYAALGGQAGQARGPAFHNIDMSLFKQFPVHEQMKFEFRAEAFNAGNWAEYANPSNLDIANPTHFGQITGVRNNNRILQLALKFYF
jgi:hypothetical protein